MKRANGFCTPSSFEYIVGSNESNEVEMTPNKKKLPQLERPKLEELNDFFLRKLPIALSPSAKE